MPSITSVSSATPARSTADRTVEAGSGTAMICNRLYNGVRTLFASNGKSGAVGYAKLNGSGSVKNEQDSVHNLDPEHAHRIAAQNVAHDCASLAYSDIRKTFDEHFDAILKLDPKYRSKPIAQMARVAAKFDKDDALFAFTNASIAIDRLHEKQRTAFDDLKEVLLTRASQRDYGHEPDFEAFKTLIEGTDRLAPELRNRPLNHLARAIFDLPHKHTSDAYAYFRDAFEKLPIELRTGLVGIYEAGQENHLSEPDQWESSAVDKILNQLAEAEGSHVASKWTDVANWYGLSYASKEKIREAIIVRYANPAAVRGENIAKTLAHYDLNDEQSRASVSTTALSGKEIIAALQTGESYLRVADSFGITDRNALKEMSKMAGSFYRQREKTVHTR